ncbi:adenosylcobinamide-GDP ribazoletransferase [Streptomyces sp. TRM43335]|uniref:Adenosylcobinamide-GDP ribazoletransferase n=1 Tax=Streptomyces taklimakanensis TaxID=2569853 RepID=A0A6G2B8X7_9ACTN|nr:adenosylcobinamide-GDP ribazoletransferase [Streptomyces taklimakanensis]MTE18721.1 adenosylcobinamide-GDP ribazoletransferase [Streptomyces taklimakanensis]
MDTTARPPSDPPPPGSAPPARVVDGVRFAFGTLTVLPVRVPRWDRAAARYGMACAPSAGLVVGMCAAAVGASALALGASPLLAAVATVAVPAVLTRGLHLDGLADVADGLGSGRPAEGALEVMRRSDIGPFGVVVLVLALLGQVAAVAELYADGWAHGAVAVVVSAVVARAALTLATREGVPAARPEGLGAAVAGVVPVRVAAATGTAVVLAAGGAGAPWGAYASVRCAAAAVLGLCAAQWLLARCRRRLGGVTGDVLGALAEAALTTSLLVLALG